MKIAKIVVAGLIVLSSTQAFAASAKVSKPGTSVQAKKLTNAEMAKVFAGSGGKDGAKVENAFRGFRKI